MRLSHVLSFAAIISIIYVISIMGSGCAQIGAPTGGPRDSLPPVLIGANPKLFATQFATNKITLSFDEYIDIQDVQNNVLVSPFPKNSPTIEFKLKTVTIKIKDTLLPNTTYSINFGNALRDNNEGNPLRNFTYVFSTGKTIDSLELPGKVIIAETGKKDSTIVALLYRNLADSAVQKRKPDYLARLDSAGNFRFRNLSEGRYKLYALKDGDGGKTYNSKTELFAFTDSAVVVGASNQPVTLFAFAEEKDIKKAGTTTQAGGKGTQADKRLRLTSNLSNDLQDLLSDLIVTANRPLKLFDPQKILLTDSNYRQVEGSVTLDSNRFIHVKSKWKQGEPYRLIISKDAIGDSAGTQLTRVDTIRFTVKKETDYGSLTIRFSNVVASRHSLLQFVKSDEIYKTVPITSSQWTDKLFVPGEYELRILTDDNNNGKWDPGSYEKKLQPERAVTLPNKLNIKANWDNERDIKL
jgi:uncharacterized protein (DUF2141 family)